MRTLQKYIFFFRYANKMAIPAEAEEDPNVKQCYTKYEMIIDEFWVAYKEECFAKRECIEASELQNDIVKMNQDIKNLLHRNQSQWEKLNNIPNKENLLYLGKNYRACLTEQRNLMKQVKENLEAIATLEFQVKNMEDKWSRRGRYPIVDVNIFEVIQEEAHVNKIFLTSHLPQELENEKNLASVVEKSVDSSCPSRETLHKLVAQAKDEVQLLMNEKLSLYANTEDKLGPFRKQASTIAQKKLEESNDIKDSKSTIARIDEAIREKEIALFNVVGGEILHGDELKHFIAGLREKSTLYKNLRAQLQSFASEQGVVSRSLDVLKNIDPTIEDAFFNASATTLEKFPVEFLGNISDAKLLCKDFMQDIENLKTSIAQTHAHLAHTKKDVESISGTMNSVKDIFENATSTVAEEVSQLKEQLRETQSDIDSLEKTWKTTTQSLDKNEYIFNRLIDEMINDSDITGSESGSYLTALAKKKDENQLLVQKTQETVRRLEECKREEREIVEFYKHTEYLVLEKFEEED
ncbi:hypothetical protein AMK59_5960 [Oryctes borbonicus]|uniref:Uncharacterized protein n=1 Tax=Oryctes borbonicus TaxID=1629725 RepID=A0A0T6B0M1_9SCAR|nr:hypothetical protein AMK59_5960 [Oryctes borbonicus]